MEVKWSLMDKTSFIGCMTSKKLDTTLHKWKWNGGTKWSEMSLIDNGSTILFSGTFYDFFF